MYMYIRGHLLQMFTVPRTTSIHGIASKPIYDFYKFKLSAASTHVAAARYFITHKCQLRLLYGFPLI